MAMTLNNTPLGPQRIKDTQPLIRDNFDNIDTAFKVNHSPYVTANAGKHNLVTFPVNADSPIVPPLAANEYAIFNQVHSILTGIPTQLILQSFLGKNIPFTARAFNSGVGTNNFCFLISGILLKFGTVNIGQTRPQTITYGTSATTLPVFDSNPFVLACYLDGGGTPNSTPLTVLNSTTTSFQVTSSSNFNASSAIVYLAIGLFSGS